MRTGITCASLDRAGSGQHIWCPSSALKCSAKVGRKSISSAMLLGASITSTMISGVSKRSAMNILESQSSAMPDADLALELMGRPL